MYFSQKSIDIFNNIVYHTYRGDKKVRINFYKNLKKFIKTY
jgi:hypothetical protein